LIGIGVVGLIVAAGAGIWMRERNNTERELAVERDGAVAVDGVQGLGKDDPKKPGGVGVGRPGGAAGALPQIAGGGSCEAAINSYNEQYTIGGGQGKPDLTAGQYGAVLNKGSYLNACGVPSNMAVNICAAVQN